jgi:hypothetical protein
MFVIEDFIIHLTLEILSIFVALPYSNGTVKLTYSLSQIAGNKLAAIIGGYCTIPFPPLFYDKGDNTIKLSPQFF